MVLIDIHVTRDKEEARRHLEGPLSGTQYSDTVLVTKSDLEEKEVSRLELKSKIDEL